MVAAHNKSRSGVQTTQTKKGKYGIVPTQVYWFFPLRENINMIYHLGIGLVQERFVKGNGPGGK
jgi:hypothetical protein